MNTGRSKAYVSSRRYGTPKDNLTLDAMDAERAGMTYGKYKAQHPNTKEENEARLKELPQRTPHPRQVYVYYCRGCGNKFISTNKKRVFCCDECKKTKENERARAKRAKKKMEEKKSD